MKKSRNFPWWGVVLGVGCGCILCIGVAGVGGFGYYYIQQTSQPIFTEVISPLPSTPTNRPAPASSPVIPEPTASITPESISSEPALTGDQQVKEFYLYDDFSSDALGWSVYDDGKTINKYENEQYSIQIMEPEYYDWSFVPVNFAPYEISFDMQGLNGQQNGTFGVFCQFQDEDNYYYVEFDLEDRSYVIAQVIDGEHIPLTPENAQGQYWQDAIPLKSTPNEVNRIAISCYLDTITLFINDEWMTNASVPTPFDQPGDMALFVYAYEFAGDEGYKIYFDNVEVYKPVQ